MRTGRAPPSGGLALALLELRADAVLLEVREQLHEDLALEVVELVLDAGGEEPGRVERETGAVPVERGHRHAFGAFHVVVDARNREAPLLVRGNAFPAGD